METNKYTSSVTMLSIIIGIFIVIGMLSLFAYLYGYNKAIKIGNKNIDEVYEYYNQTISDLQNETLRCGEYKYKCIESMDVKDINSLSACWAEFYNKNSGNGFRIKVYNFTYYGKSDCERLRSSCLNNEFNQFGCKWINSSNVCDCDVG
ncbi:MAG: hypothetical protein ACE5ES_00515 [Candidatus Nanoarchaeia archaeon]